MTRKQKIELLQAVASGQAPAEVLNGPQMMPVIILTEPDQYPIGNRVLNKAEFEAYCAKVERINSYFPDFKCGRPVVIDGTQRD